MPATIVRITGSRVDLPRPLPPRRPLQVREDAADLRVAQVDTQRLPHDPPEILLANSIGIDPHVHAALGEPGLQPLPRLRLALGHLRQQQAGGQPIHQLLRHHEIAHQ